jgi:hypothetical protein
VVTEAEAPPPEAPGAPELGEDPEAVADPAYDPDGPDPDVTA